MPHLMIGTRKGLIGLDQAADGWAVARHDFAGAPVTAILPDRRDGACYAALNLGHFGVKLHRLDPGAAEWQELPAPAFPAGYGGDPDQGPSVSQLWVLASGGADRPGRIWAGTMPGALFRSDDRGQSWALVESLWQQDSRVRWFGGGYDVPGIHSILIDPRDSDRMVVGISCGGVWLSRDGGASWALGGAGMVATYMPPEQQNDPAIQDPHRIVACPAAPDRLWTQHHNGVFRSDDRGAHWHRITGLPLSDFGFAVGVHPDEPDTAWFVPAESDQKRIPVGGRLAVTRTRDGGGSFDLLCDGLPAPPAFDLIYRHAFEVAPDGTTLAMGSTTGALWTSADGGEAWRLAHAHLPPIACLAFAG
jgi:hypothetical protein